MERNCRPPVASPSLGLLTWVLQPRAPICALDSNLYLIGATQGLELCRLLCATQTANGPPQQVDSMTGSFGSPAHNKFSM